MKLQYKVLWFDDSSEIFDSLDFDYLKEQISGWGFIPVFDLVTTPDAFKAKTPYDDYDLLVVDYNLQEYGYGEEFISQVRDQQVFTEIIFYSSGSASLLWKAVHDHKLEGIYIANKEAIPERILKIGQQTLRKVLDLENMRGIVMAEVGDLDLVLNTILTSAIAGLPAEKQTEIFDRFYAASSEHHANHKESLDKFKEAPTVELLLSLCDSDKRWQNYGRTKKHHAVLKKTVIGDYVADVLRPRNFLAHGVPTPGEDGSSIFHYQGKEFLFNETISTELRTKIIEYKKTFSQISSELAAALKK